MTFEKLYLTLVVGTPIKRKSWGGYWKYDMDEHNIRIFTKEGANILLTETDDIMITLEHTFADDWEIATNENCDIEVK